MYIQPKQREGGSDMQTDKLKMEDNFSAALSAGICGHTGFLILPSCPQGLIMKPRCFLMTMMMAEQRCPPSSHMHICARAHAHTQSSHCLSVAPLPKVPSFLSSQPIKATFNGHLSLVWLPPPTLAPAGSSPPPQPSGGQGLGPRVGHTWNRLMLFSWK